jgi:hypothetical protein
MVAERDGVESSDVGAEPRMDIRRGVGNGVGLAERGALEVPSQFRGGEFVDGAAVSERQTP